MVYTLFFVFNVAATTEIYALSLPDALPISLVTAEPPPFPPPAPPPQRSAIQAEGIFRTPCDLRPATGHRHPGIGKAAIKLDPPGILHCLVFIDTPSKEGVQKTLGEWIFSPQALTVLY